MRLCLVIASLCGGACDGAVRGDSRLGATACDGAVLGDNRLGIGACDKAVLAESRLGATACDGASASQLVSLGLYWYLAKPSKK